MLVKLDASMILKAKEQSAYSAAMSCLLISEFKAYGSVRYQHTSKRGPSSSLVKAHCSAVTGPCAFLQSFDLSYNFTLFVWFFSYYLSII